MPSPHSSARHGQAIQHRSCAAHSAGILNLCADGTAGSFVIRDFAMPYRRNATLQPAIAASPKLRVIGQKTRKL
jgi:hypothetical protein